jgi:NAD(P)H dehydrogenase (quinone)
MAKVLVLYYSTYGHIEKMAQAVAEGVRNAGAQADIKRVPETVPDDVAKRAHFKLDQAAPIATIAELEHYDAIIVGTGTRFGRISSQMACFLDQAGSLWMRGALNGKVGAAFASTGSSMAARKPRCFLLLPICCTSA